jgi:hypothetical protein
MEKKTKLDLIKEGYESARDNKPEKKYPIGGYAPGNYHNRCCTCERSFFGDKRAVQCESCAVESLREILRPYDQATPQGAVWVKASEFKTATPVYRPYRKKAMEDEGEYDYGEIYVTEDDGHIYLDIDNECNYEHQSDERWGDYEILYESAGEKEGILKVGLKFRSKVAPLCSYEVVKIFPETMEFKVKETTECQVSGTTCHEVWSIEGFEKYYNLGVYYIQKEVKP